MVKLAIFDMDGTVFESYLDWKKIKKELCIKNGNILKEIYNNNSIDYEKLNILEKHEEQNTLKTSPLNGVFEFISFLKNNNIKISLITNNNKKNTEYLLNKFNLKFDVVITRDMKLWKPDADAFFYLMNLYKYTPEEILSIGDSHYDIIASKKAGISDVFIVKKNKKNGVEYSIQDDKRFSGEKIVFFNDYFELKKIFIEKYNIKNI
jgi:HAD superfamily hydrolase (TIGR01549 family)